MKNFIRIATLVAIVLLALVTIQIARLDNHIEKKIDDIERTECIKKAAYELQEKESRITYGSI